MPLKKGRFAINRQTNKQKKQEMLHILTIAIGQIKEAICNLKKV